MSATNGVARRRKVPGMSGIATLAMINIDAADPAALASFYSRLLGWEVVHSADDYAMVSDGTMSIGFGRLPGYAGPGWPGETTPKRFHLDLYVDDLDKAEEQALALGASKPDAQPEPQRWRVLLDPGGHPFDLCARPQG
ncbi:glyoxalase/bleomycin resistance protein/dioxygenase superfamily protein [Krasilnikovia cinnamomea]|uniref:Glyoxalase/bleomycin resistance protein/dioxygenase superfamily protein n=2 Tax=Krasilnikovia cinnamomea TaxID=349313 RepID=A0A4V2G6M3_9ACTN|nr:glyoxalase/bleomycin resistance protein/dioxygenase superfamily protein [Krasilnikovia cinnamomea]